MSLDIEYFQLSGTCSQSLKEWKTRKVEVGSKHENWQNWTAARLATIIVGEPCMWGATFRPTMDAWRKLGAPWTSSCAAFTPRRRCLPGTRRGTSNTRGKRLVPFNVSFQDHSSFICMGHQNGEGIYKGTRISRDWSTLCHDVLSNDLEWPSVTQL